MRIDRLTRLADFLEPRDDWNLGSWNTCAAGTAIKHGIFEAEGLRQYGDMRYYPAFRRGDGALLYGLHALAVFFEISTGQTQQLFGGKSLDPMGDCQLFMRVIRAMIAEHKAYERTMTVAREVMEEHREALQNMAQMEDVPSLVDA
jgi:hypothetical protein